MKNGDWFHFGLGIVTLVLSIFLYFAFGITEYGYSIELIYIGIICFVCGLILFFIHGLKEIGLDDDNRT